MHSLRRLGSTVRNARMRIGKTLDKLSQETGIQYSVLLRLEEGSLLPLDKLRMVKLELALEMSEGGLLQPSIGYKNGIKDFLRDHALEVRAIVDVLGCYSWEKVKRVIKSTASSQGESEQRKEVIRMAAKKSKKTTKKAPAKRATK